MTTTNAVALGLPRFLGHQDWIRYGLRDRVLRLFCNPDHVQRHGFEVDYFGLQYQGTLDSFLDWLVYFYGAHEKYELRLLQALVRGVARPVFHVTIHNVALGSDDGELSYFAARGTNQGTGSFLRSHAADNNAFFGRLQVVHADRYITDLHLDHIDLVKIDVEGFERDVLMGLRNTLARYRPVVFMEFSPEIRDAFAGRDDLIAMLPAGYVVESVQTYETRCVFCGAPRRRCLEFDFDAPHGHIVFGPRQHLDT